MYSCHWKAASRTQFMPLFSNCKNKLTRNTGYSGNTEQNTTVTDAVNNSSICCSHMKLTQNSTEYSFCEIKFIPMYVLHIRKKISGRNCFRLDALMLLPRYAQKLQDGERQNQRTVEQSLSGCPRA